MTSLIRKPVGPNQMIYDSERDAVHILNATAQVVEDLHRKGFNAEAIAGELRKQFQVQGIDTVLEDVRACLEKLAAQQLMD